MKARGADGEIHIRKEGRAGRITLARPDALNALTWDMALAMEAALREWAEDDAVELVVVDAEGTRAFCAGGDVENLYRHGVDGDHDYGRRFWADEYRLNALIANYEKPYVAFLQGFVMGGGVGIGCHGFFRVVGESTRIAMPECAIGLIPDVGGSLLLGHAPGRLGEYLGLTGTRMEAGDAIHAGFADSFVPEAEWERLKARLIADGDPDVVDDFMADPPPSRLAGLQGEIDRAFKPAALDKVLAALQASRSEWAGEALAAIRSSSPLSVACAWAVIRKGRGFKEIGKALEMEYRFTSRSMSHGEFLEGIRAMIIDKDRTPRWRAASVEEVSADEVAAMLAPVPVDLRREREEA